MLFRISDLIIYGGTILLSKKINLFNIYNAGLSNICLIEKQFHLKVQSINNDTYVEKLLGNKTEFWS